jgi:hypothetical protein
MIRVNRNQRQLAKYRRRFVARAMGLSSIQNSQEAETQYEGTLMTLQVTADQLFEMLQGNPWPYLSIEQLRVSRTNERSPLHLLEFARKAEFMEILMGEVLQGLIEELAAHGIEWVDPWSRPQPRRREERVNWRREGF